MILLDTNILVHSKQATSPHFAEVKQRLTELIQDDEELAICPQVVYEFYVVATRPQNQNGLGISCADALTEIHDLLDVYTFINDPDNLFTIWHALIQQFQTLGKNAHDTRLIAFMQSQGIERLYTLNGYDFDHYTHITLL